MNCKATEKVIKEEISEVYIVDGVEYKADIATYGPYGVYGNMAYQDQQAVINLENLGKVRVIFPKGTMLIPSENNPARFSPYAEQIIEKAVRKYITYNNSIKDKRFVNRVIEFEVV